MPTYEYQCFSCNHQFEVFQKITEEPVKVCPACKANSGSVKRLLSAAPFHLKGSGWYKTDYSSGKSSSPASSTAAVKQSEASAKPKDEPAAEMPSKTADTSKKESSSTSSDKSS